MPRTASILSPASRGIKRWARIHSYMERLSPLFTGIWWLGAFEVVIHWLTDDAKCHGKLTFNQDQAIHILCKLACSLSGGCHDADA